MPVPNPHQQGDGNQSHQPGEHYPPPRGEAREMWGPGSLRNPTWANLHSMGAPALELQWDHGPPAACTPGPGAYVRRRMQSGSAVAPPMGMCMLRSQEKQEIMGKSLQIPRSYQRCGQLSEVPPQSTQQAPQKGPGPGLQEGGSRSGQRGTSSCSGPGVRVVPRTVLSQGGDC